MPRSKVLPDCFESSTAARPRRIAIATAGDVLVGTTDTAIDIVSLEPVLFEQEIEFILETAGQYLAKVPRRGDILSAWAVYAH